MSRVMKKNSFPNIQVGFFLIEVAFSCKPLDLLMRSTDIREPLMPHGFEVFQQILILVAWTEEMDCVIK
jgi:hypothetical protein